MDALTAFADAVSRDNGASPETRAAATALLAEQSDLAESFRLHALNG